MAFEMYEMNVYLHHDFNNMISIHFIIYIRETILYDCLVSRISIHPSHGPFSFNIGATSPDKSSTELQLRRLSKAGWMQVLSMIIDN